MNKGKRFWNKEYKDAKHLSLSVNPSEDLEKFGRWLEREYGEGYLKGAFVADLGCGNGRNLIFLAKEYGAVGEGFDISDTAIKQAKAEAKGLPIRFSVGSINKPIGLPDGSVDLALDMMTSHVLNEAERGEYLKELARVLKPRGYLFLKTFLLDEDRNAMKMLKEHPAGERNAYIHPTLGVYEHVWTEDELVEFYFPYFEVKKIERSHKHILRGKAFKRRHIIAYLERK